MHRAVQPDGHVAEAAPVAENGEGEARELHGIKVNLTQKMGG
jgi:hypothetical protein